MVARRVRPVMGLWVSRPVHMLVGAVVLVVAFAVLRPCASPASGAEGVPAFRNGNPGALVALALPDPKPFRTKDGKTGWGVRITNSSTRITPAVSDGVVYVGGAMGDHGLFAIDAATGKKIWSYQTGDNGPTSPVVSGRYLSYGTESCTLYIHDSRSGQLLWSRYLGDPLVGVPAADGERIFVTYPRAGGYRLIAFTLKDGGFLWDQAISSEILTTPVIEGDSVYAATVDGRLARFDVKTGRQHWSVKCGVTAAPRVAGNLVFFAQRHMANVRVGGAEHFVLVEKPHERVNIINAETGELISDAASEPVEAPHLASISTRFPPVPEGSFKGAVANIGVADLDGLWGWQGSTPCVLGHRVLMGGGNVLRSLNPADGSAYWQLSVQCKAAAGRAVSPPAAVGDKVFIGTADGAIACVDANTGRPLWQAEVGGSMTSQPAVADGRIYFVRTDGMLVCLQTGDPCADGWTMLGGSPRHNGPERPGVLLASARSTDGSNPGRGN